MSTPTVRRRPYQSTRRAEQAARTSADIVAAATRLLTRDGWGNTTMTKVAAEAGVAVETVYQRFKSKADLLRAAVDATIGGGTSQPLQEQERFTRLGHGETAERLATLALLATDINARTHALFESWRQAAGADAAIAAELLEYETHRRSDAAAALALIRGGPVDERTVDAVWAVSSPDVYSKLVRDRAWSSSNYADFVQEIVRALLAVDAP